MNWSCTPSASCGTFNPTTTATGVATTYTAPATVTSGVVITATLATDLPQSPPAPAPSALPAATLADGNYVFSLSGQDINSLYSVSGVFTRRRDSAPVAAGEQDFVDFGVDLPSTRSTRRQQRDHHRRRQPADHSGDLQRNGLHQRGRSCAQADGIETLAGSVLPSNTNKALITEFDASATSSGELDLQGAVAHAVRRSMPSASMVWISATTFLRSAALSTSMVPGNDLGSRQHFRPQRWLNGGLFQGETFAGRAPFTAPDSFGRVTFTLNTTRTSHRSSSLATSSTPARSGWWKSFDGFGGSHRRHRL